MENSSSLELEVKILNVQEDEVVDFLEQYAKLLGREIQTNYVFENLNAPFPKGDYLRIRHSDAHESLELTYKENKKNLHFRENLETTVQFDDLDSMILILNKLGYSMVSKGKKRRSSYLIGESRLDFDHWLDEGYPEPYLEVETVSREKLEEIINLLNLKNKEVSLLSIEELKSKTS